MTNLQTEQDVRQLYNDLSLTKIRNRSKRLGKFESDAVLLVLGTLVATIGRAIDDA